MRFMIMHKMTPAMEQSVPPTPEEMQQIGGLIADATEQGVFVSGEGLQPTSTRFRVQYAGGQRTITDGPFTEAKELVAGFALLSVRSKAQAIEWCDKLAEARGVDTELFVGPVHEPWDLGMMPKPDDAPLRFLSLLMTNPAVDVDREHGAEEMERMGALIEEGTRAGVLQAVGGLKSAHHGARIHFEGGKHKVIDGPFAESKELVAGYAIFELPSLEVAIDWAVRFGVIVRVHEIDVRVMHEG